MRKVFATILPLFLLCASCSLLGESFELNDSSSVRGRSPGHRQDHDDLPDSPDPSDTSAVLPEVLPDTLVWVSAVSFPKDYDWQRDTAYGCRDARIVLYRNFKPLFSVPACDGASPDRHHISEGHLYSEYTSTDSTFFRCDTSVYLALKGSYTLSGLIEDASGGVYVLASSRSGSGFTLLRDGVVLMSKPSGTVLGGFGDPSYGSGGALYVDGGYIYFCFCVEKWGERIFYVVENGVERQVTSISDAASVDDLKIMDGCVTTATVKCMGSIWEDTRVWNTASGPVQSGGITAMRGEDKRLRAGIYRFLVPCYEYLCEGEAEIYLDENSAYAVSWTSTGELSIHSSRSQSPSSLPGKWCYFYPSCAKMAFGRLLMAATPVDEGAGIQVLWGDDKTWELEGVRGFASGVDVTVNRPS